MDIEYHRGIGVLKPFDNKMVLAKLSSFRWMIHHFPTIRELARERTREKERERDHTRNFHGIPCLFSIISLKCRKKRLAIFPENVFPLLAFLLSVPSASWKLYTNTKSVQKYVKTALSDGEIWKCIYPRKFV